YISYINYITIIILNYYKLTNILNQKQYKNTKIEYINTLGARLTGREVTPLLAGRIDKSIELQQKQKQGKIVLSGGQGEDEIIPEGEAMAQYALDKGVDPKIIIKETNSKNTFRSEEHTSEIQSR